MVRTCCLLALAAILTIPSVPAQGAQAKWTFMVYMDADNNLEPDGIDDFLEMAQIGSTDDVNIVVLFDRIPDHSDEYDNWADTRRGRVEKGDTPGIDWGVSVGEKNMGDPQTLIDFITWATTTYPAERYALVLWDHGDGWRLMPDKMTIKAVCWDDTNNSNLAMAEVRQALASAAIHFDLVAFDACLMGMVEVGYEIRQYADVMVASQETEPGGGWPYHMALDDLVATPTLTAAEFGRAAVEGYYAYYGSQTQAAVDLTQFDDLAARVDDLAAALRTSWSDDISSCTAAANALKSAVQSAVIYERHGPSYDANGLCLYFPASSGQMSSSYNSSVILLPGATQWEEFLGEYYNTMTMSWVALARANTFDDFFATGHIDLVDFCDALIEYAPTGVRVMPLADATFDGEPGGPYSPAATSYTLTNYGSTTAQWTAQFNVNWLSCNPSSGAIVPGASQVVLLAPNAATSLLGGGAFEGIVTFSADTDAVDDERGVVLQLSGQPIDAFRYFALDTSPGWTTEGSWEFGQPLGNQGDPASGKTGANVYGYNLAGAYENDIDPPYYLTTDAIDCSGYGNVKLGFWRWLGVESSVFDGAAIEARAGTSGPWTAVWNHTGASLEPSGWTYCEYDISTVADNQATVYIRWAMGTTDISVAYAGWNIDDIALTGDALQALPALSDAQICYGQSDGTFTMSAWNLDLGASLGGIEATGSGTLTYELPTGQWAGIYLYDYNGSAYVAGQYVLRNATP